MPEIKNTFLKGKMNKDLDERLIPNGEYRDALNIKVSTSEDSEVGTVQTILGNQRADTLVPNDHVCVGSIADEKTNKLYWFTKTSSVDLILEYDQNTDVSKYVFVDTKTNTDDAVLKFPDKIITGINIIDNLLFWTDGISEPKKINISNCIQGTIQDPSIALQNHTKLVVKNVNTLIDVKEENITVIKKKPTKAPVTNIIFQQNTSNNNDKNSLFEKTFSRFCLRYRYEDGEYSAFGPFSDIVFNPQYVKNSNFQELNTIAGAKENNFTRKEPFNRAMVNKIDTIQIFDFVAPDMPDDVIEIEILYKQEDIPTIYSIAKLDIDDNSWQKTGYNDGNTNVSNSGYKGQYDISTENIYAALPENQFIRVFDNVPKSALAQEVTGNRIVYGNYTQNYDVKRNEYNHVVSLGERINTDYSNNALLNSSFDYGPQKSLKSLRNYQVGIVFGDKYGRETPVFTTEKAALSVPWEDVQQGFNASRKLSLEVDYNTSYPTWADYFKYYIKETSSEYYNLFMDKAFVPTSQDDIDRNKASDHIWLSFFSSDRNKVKEEDHIILKKIFAADPGQVTKNNKFKIIDIKNEAPDSIKFDYKTLYVEVDNVVYNDVFNINGNRITDVTDTIILNQADYLTAGGYDFLSTDRSGATPTEPQFKFTDHYISWKDTSSSPSQSSAKYRIDNVSSVNNEFVIKLDKTIATADANLADSLGATGNILSNNLQIIVERKQKRDLDQFSGRFFVKVAFNLLAADIQDIIPDLISSFTPIESFGIRHFIDEIDGNELDPSLVAVNNDNAGAEQYSGTGSNIVNGMSLGSGITNTESNWNTITNEISNGTDEPEFFIDSMFYCAGNWGAEIGSAWAKRATNVQRGNGVGSSQGTRYTNVIWTDDIHSSGSITDTLPWRGLGTDGVTVFKNTGRVNKNYYPYLKYTNYQQGPYQYWNGSNKNPGSSDFIEYNGPDGVYGGGGLYDVSGNETSFLYTGPGGYQTVTTYLGEDAPDAWEFPGLDLTGTTLQNYIDPPVGGAGQISHNPPANVPKWRWYPLDKDAFTMGGYDGIDAYYLNTSNPWRGAVINAHPNSSSVYGNNVEFPIRFFNKYVGLTPNNPGVVSIVPGPPSHFGTLGTGSISGDSDASNVVNALEGFIVSDTKHTNGVRSWVDPSTQSKVYADFIQDSTYGQSGEEGKFYLHVSFLAPGKDLTDNTFNLPASMSFQGPNCLGAYLQGIHGGGVFTKSFEEALSDGGDAFDNTSNWDSQRTIHCEGSTNNTSNLDIGYNQNFVSLHDQQWDPTKTPYGDPGGFLSTFINQLTSTGSFFKFSGDTNNTFYQILSCTKKYLYNHTPWRRRYIRDVNGSAPSNVSYTDENAINSFNIPAGDSVEEAAVAWAKAKATGDPTEGSKLTALQNKIISFSKRNNRRIVYIIELDKNPTDASVNGGFNPFDANLNGSNITAANPNNFEFISTTPDFTQGTSSINPAIWETEPQKNTDLDIYYEASKAIPLNLNSFNRELFANIGCAVTSSEASAINPGTTVYLQDWREEDGEQIVTLSPGFNSVNVIGVPIVYENTTINFINKDSSFVSSTIVASNVIPAATPGASTYANEFSIKLEHPSSKVGLSWYNCFSLGNGIESNRIRDDFNQMQITNGARASAVIEEPYSVEQKKNGLIYSGIYNSISNINNLNQFIVGEKITKDLNPTYGSIQKLFQRRISLVAFCEDKVVSIVSNKDALFNADGNSQLVSTDKVLGDATPFVGDYGISKNPESFAKESYRAYFTDKNRGAVLRLSKDGITPISQAGMHDWFRDHLPLANNLIGSYDEYNQDYNLSLIIDLPSYNLIENSYLTYGQAEILETTGGASKIYDGYLNQSTNFNFPQALPWRTTTHETALISGSMQVISENSGIINGVSNVGLFNQDLKSRVRVIKFEEIPQGYYFAGDNSGANSPGSGLPGDPGSGFIAYTPPTYSGILSTPNNVGSTSISSQHVYKWDDYFNIFMAKPIASPPSSSAIYYPSPIQIGETGFNEAYIQGIINNLKTPEQSAYNLFDFNYSAPGPPNFWYGNSLQDHKASVYVNLTDLSGTLAFAMEKPKDYYNLHGGYSGDISSGVGAGFVLKSKADSTLFTESPGHITDSNNGTVGNNISSGYNSNAHSLITSDPNVLDSLATDLTVFKGETIVVEYSLMVNHIAVDANGDEVTNFDFINYGWQDGALINNSITDSGGNYDNPAASFTGQTYPLPNGFPNGNSLGSSALLVKLKDGNNNYVDPALMSTGPGTPFSLLSGSETYYESYKDTVNNNSNSWISESPTTSFPTWYKVAGNGKNLRCKARYVFKFLPQSEVFQPGAESISHLIAVENLQVECEFATSLNMVPRAGHGTTAVSIFPQVFNVKAINVYKLGPLSGMPVYGTQGVNPVPAEPPAPPVTIPGWHEIQIGQDSWTTSTPDLVDLHATATSIHGPNTGPVTTDTFSYSMQPDPNPYNLPFQTYTVEHHVDPGTNSFGTANTKADGTPYTNSEIYRVMGPPPPTNLYGNVTYLWNQFHYDDTIEVLQSGTGGTPVPNLSQTLSVPYTVGNYYLLDIVTTKTATEVATNLGKNHDDSAISIRGCFDQSAGSAITSAAIWGEQSGYNGYPHHHFGRVRGPGTYRELQALSIDPTKDASNDPWDSGSVTSVFQNIWNQDNGQFINVNSPFLHSKFNYNNYSADTHILRTIFKVENNSFIANSTNGQSINGLNINLYNCIGGLVDDPSSNYGAIKGIRLIDLGNENTTGYQRGDAAGFVLAGSSQSERPHLMVQPRFYVNNNTLYGNGLVHNMLHREGDPTFSSVTAHTHMSQRYANPNGQGANEVSLLAPETSPDGYDFRFNIVDEFLTNSFHGGIYVRVIGVNGLGFEIHGINTVGRYRVIADVGNNVDPTTNGTSWGIQYDPNGGNNFQPIYQGATLSPADYSSIPAGNFGRFYGTVYFAGTLASNNHFAFGINNVSLADQQTQLTVSAASSWSFLNNSGATNIPTDGFKWINGSLVINATSTASAVQSIGNLPLGTKIRFKVNYEELGLTDGTVDFIYVNDQMQGFMIQAGAYDGAIGSTANGAGINYHRDIWPVGSSGTYEVETEVQSFTGNHPLLQNGAVISGSYFYTSEIPAVNSLIVKTNNQYGDGPGVGQHIANYSLDNFSMTPFVSINLSNNKTVSFSEDVGGWVSFKSFTPENGLSLSKRYYTFNQGGLYKHDTQVNGYNNFYGNQFDSSITAILNSDASTVKSFKTLGYEGSKSNSSQFELVQITDVETQQTISIDNINYSHFNNLTPETGWYVQSVFTDKQDGFIDDFIEKEGKWFNYIKGGLQNINQDYISKHTGDFSFQGLGEIETIQDITLTVPGEDQLLSLGTAAPTVNTNTTTVTSPTQTTPATPGYSSPSTAPGGGTTTIY